MDQSKQKSIVSLKALHKSFRTDAGEVHALKGITLDIFPGEFCMLMGASGSGKSTLLNLIGCLDRPTRGEYRLYDVDVASIAADELAAIRNTRIGFVFQSFNLLGRATALENIELPLLCGSNSRWTTHKARERAQYCLNLVGLANRADHFPSQLSGGQQQRVAIARALANAPQLIFADEPTGNLDSITSLEILSLLQKLNDTGITIVMVTHEFENSLYGSRRLVLRDGLLIKDETVVGRLNATEKLAHAKAEEIMNFT